MANEATKFRRRWFREGLWNQYFCRPNLKILDIGCGSDKIIETADGYDKEQGDGQLLSGLKDSSYDIIFSSHFIEHLRDPIEGLLNQWRVLKPGGYLIFLIPDEDLYEQGVWPSKFNTDHKHTYTIQKSITWSPASKNVADLIRYLPNHKIVSLRIVDAGYNYQERSILDQTGGEAEAAIEGIIQKIDVQYGWQTKLETAFVCPSCHHLEFVIRGITPDATFDAWCKHCGMQGTLKKRDDANTGTLAEPAKDTAGA